MGLPGLSLQDTIIAKSAKRFRQALHQALPAKDVLFFVVFGVRQIPPGVAVNGYPLF
jgi:hypothetical protein